MDRAYIFLADGFEDIEALATRDTLIRAGVEVVLTAAGDEPFITSSHGLTVSADALLEEISLDSSDVMVFPGGMPGSRNLAGNRQLIKLMQAHYGAGGTVAAICAAPGLVLSQLPLPKGIPVTCFDGFEEALVAKGAHFVRKPAVSSGTGAEGSGGARVITGRSAGYSIPFALEIASAIKGREAAGKAASGLLLPVE